MKSKEIYLDHSATTYLDPRVKKQMDKYFCEEFGNPGSFNTIGLRAKKAIAKARNGIANILGAKPNEIVFTGTGTESVNLAIKGVVRANKDKGKHIITTTIEHHAVLDTCEYLEKYEGFKVTYLEVDKYGSVTPEQVEKAIRKDTVLISVMYANNEIGTIEPIKEIGKIAKKHKVLFHTDACQAGCSQDLNVNNLNVDLMTLNGSKIYGPKGTGMLYIRKGVRIQPIIHGGGQERGLRSGTENVPGIVGLAKALELCQKEKEKENQRLIKLRDKLIKEITSKIPKTFLNGHPTKRLPNNANITILDIEGEAIMLYMNKYGICASSGSACTSKTLDPSHVIMAIGLPYEAAHGSIRFSIGSRTTEKDIDKVIKVLPGIVENLREISPVNLELEDVLEKVIK
ncbi:MAG: cysteine desulfurase NifS [DPANN group archaeon]|nr:cysteine desulfurase NifS [DPANN group archaeon]